MWYSYYGNGYDAANWPDSYRENNANNIAYYFTQRGWTIDSVCAMLGNMQLESYLNPAQWEHGYPVEVVGTHGFGLVQWTPWTKYTTWAGADWKTNFDKQLERITYELQNDEQWISTTTYPLSFYQFTQATDAQYTLDWLTLCFFYDYERGVGGESIRQSNARHWYQYFTGNPPTPPTPGPTPASNNRMKLMFYLKPKWKRGY